MSLFNLFPIEPIYIKANNEYSLPKHNEKTILKYSNFIKVIIILVLLLMIFVCAISFIERSKVTGLLYFALIIFILFLSFKRKIFNNKPYLILSDKGIEYQDEIISWDEIKTIDIIRNRRKFRIVSKLFIKTNNDHEYLIPILSLNKKVSEIAHLIGCYKNKNFKII